MPKTDKSTKKPSKTVSNEPLPDTSQLGLAKRDFKEVTKKALSNKGKVTILDVEALKERIGFQPNAWQYGVLANLKRFTKIVGGKRSGKSMLTSYLAFRELQATDRLIWVVAPTYELSTRVWDNIEPWANRFSYLKIRKSDPIYGRSIENILTGSVLRIKSADNPKQLKGDAGDLLIVEECGDMAEDVWPKYLEPFISQTRPATGQKGRALLIGNASHKGSWFHRLWSEPNDEDNYSHWQPTAIENPDGTIIASANPEIIGVEELMRLKKANSSRVWEQEWIAKFIAGTGAVFRNVNACVKNADSNPRSGHYYFMGLDLAKHQDWTVMTVIDARTFEVVHIDRFNQIDWPLQKLRIFETAKRYNNATIWMDATGIGDPVYDDLQRMGLDVHGYKLSNTSKKALVEKAAIFVEQAKITIPDNEDLKRELDLFTYEISSSGNTVYNAPSGVHDDMVISLSLAVWPLPDQKSQMPVQRVEAEEEEEYISDAY